MFSSRRSEVHERAAVAYDDVAQTFDRLGVPIVFTPPAKDLIRLLRLPTMARVLDVVWPGNWIWLNPCQLFTVRGLLAIMNQRDVELPGSIPVRVDRRRRMDEPTPIAGH